MPIIPIDGIIKKLARSTATAINTQITASSFSLPTQQVTCWPS
jgi:hypothetical protein